MGDTTEISWTDATFNPWWGCEKVSPACAHCYAERDSNRYGYKIWGDDHEFRFLSESNWQKPLRWARLAREGKLPDGSPLPDGRRPRVFTASMADVFEERPEVRGARARLFAIIAATPELDWLVLTKRPEYARAVLRHSMFWLDVNAALLDMGHPVIPGGMTDFAAGRDWLPNLWMGVSIENSRFTWRADILRQIPCAVRFLSCEPLLGSLFEEARVGGRYFSPSDFPRMTTPPRRPLNLEGIDWVIVGGESGPKARPMHPDWAREIRDACLEATMPAGGLPHGEHPYDYGHARPAFHFKQWGEWSTQEQSGVRNTKLTRSRFEYESNRFSGDGTRYDPFKPDLYSYPGMESLLRVGRRKAGRMLDGRTWDEFPRSAVPAGVVS